MLPAIVIEGSEDAVALFQPTGTVCKRRRGQRGGPQGRSLLPGAWDGGHEDWVFPNSSTIKLHIPGESFSVLRRYRDGDGFEGWYINLELPWIRTPIGFDSRDLILDVVAAEDLSSWTWKDEDEFEWAVETGTIGAAEKVRTRRAGERAIEMMEAREFPFTDAWERFRPDGEWGLPEVPHGWRDLFDVRTRA